MKKDSYILKLYRLPQTVFTAKDIALVWKETNRDILKSRVSYYLKTGKIIPLRRGIYARDDNFNILELATKIYVPSYISFETAAYREGLVFQYYQTVFVASYLSREISINSQNFSYRRIKNEILTNTLGITENNNFFIAGKERAFLDILYLNKDYYFDNLRPLDWALVFDILPIYKNKRMEKAVNRIYKDSKID